MDNSKYAIQFFFNPTFHDSTIIEKIIEVSNFVSNYLQTVYTNIGYCVNEGNKRKTYSYVYSAKALEKMRKYKYSDITAISFEKLKRKNYFLDTDITLGILLSRKDDFPTRMILLVDPNFQKDFSFNKLNDCINFMKTLGLELEYGMGMILDEEKMPRLFLTGLKTPNLSNEERDIVDALALNIREYKTKIWDVFAYNIIKKDIVSSEMIENINKISNNILFEENDFYIILLCNDIDSFISKNDKFERDRQELRKIFRNENGIMYNTQ